MIKAFTRARKTRAVTTALPGLLLAVLIGMAGPGWAEVPTHPVESSFLMEKMWETPRSSAEIRDGIEAALKIPDWQLTGTTRAATQWSRVGGTIIDTSIEHDKVGRVRSAAPKRCPPSRRSPPPQAIRRVSGAHCPVRCTIGAASRRRASRR